MPCHPQIDIPRSARYPPLSPASISPSVATRPSTPAGGRGQASLGHAWAEQDGSLSTTPPTAHQLRDSGLRYYSARPHSRPRDRAYPSSTFMHSCIWRAAGRGGGLLQFLVKSSAINWTARRSILDLNCTLWGNDSKSIRSHDSQDEKGPYRSMLRT